jgi:hypothetical protein
MKIQFHLFFYLLPLSIGKTSIIKITFIVTNFNKILKYENFDYEKKR